MAQGSQFPLRKPPGFHWDFFLLGITTFIAGLIGVPAPNGLIPQAPIHTESLVILGPANKKADVENPASFANSTDPSSVELSRRPGGKESDVHTRQGTLVDPLDPASDLTVLAGLEVPIAVVEQRVSNLAQGALCMVLLTSPFLHVLSLIPRGVLAGLL
jgi:hypothetical protein